MEGFNSYRQDANRRRVAPKFMRTASEVLAIAAANATSQAPRDLLNSVNHVLSNDEFYSSLSKLLPTPRSGQPPPRKRLREAEFRKVSELCGLRGKNTWALRPRTFVILHMIGREDLMDDFLKESRSDVCLPYTENNLPLALTGEARARFLEYQQNVLTGQGVKLERPGGEHQHIQGSADDLFIHLRTLGTGSSGWVDCVLGRLTLEQFARKRIQREDFSSLDQRGLSLFENELNILKRLSHRHIVKLVGSYTDFDCVGLIMSPVADKNLTMFLRERLPPEGDRDRGIRIRSFFGCIATAVDYLHKHEVRHKDIKPHNILVKDRKVYIADFGTSFHWGNGSTDTTEGTLHGFTPKYVAPEATTGVSP